MVAHINIGSNLGDSRSLIGQAVAEIALLSSTPPRTSSLIESEPWGYTSPHRFTNIGIEITTSLTPENLLGKLLQIQATISPLSHRDSFGNYTDRLIDIDLIHCGDLIINTPTLTLPHPRLHLRDFVLLPLLELSPTWHHPILHLTPSQMLATL